MSVFHLIHIEEEGVCLLKLQVLPDESQNPTDLLVPIHLQCSSEVEHLCRIDEFWLRTIKYLVVLLFHDWGISSSLQSHLHLARLDNRLFLRLSLNPEYSRIIYYIVDVKPINLVKVAFKLTLTAGDSE